MTISDAANPPLDVAGSHVQYDGLLVNDAQLLGVSGNQRHTTFGYGGRGRLRGSVTAANGAKQVTYNGLPLYTLKGAKAFSVAGNGGMWHVVKLPKSAITATG